VIKWVNTFVAKIFYTPSGYSGTAQLTASNGLDIADQGRWRFSQQGYNDGASFGLSIGWPDKPQGSDFSYGPNTPKIKPQSGGLLHLRAQNWPIAVIGNSLTSYTDPTYGVLPATQCRIQIVGQWQVLRQQNSNSYNSFGCEYTGHSATDLGTREFTVNLLSYNTVFATYVIQGSAVTGGAQNTFSSHEFFCRITENVSSDNSNREFQSNTISSPIFVYTYSKSWEIDV
jgi:hypothetical protein